MQTSSSDEQSMDFDSHDTGSDDDDQAAILSGEHEMVGTLVAMDFPLYEASNVHWFKGSVKSERIVTCHRHHALLTTCLRSRERNTVRFHPGPG
jgi:hypothetical protein